MPPLQTPIRNTLGRDGMPAAAFVRPPRNGPILRHCSSPKIAGSNVVAFWALVIDSRAATRTRTIRAVAVKPNRSTPRPREVTEKLLPRAGERTAGGGRVPSAHHWQESQNTQP